jgi:hypothetical protein
MIERKIFQIKNPDPVESVSLLFKSTEMSVFNSQLDIGILYNCKQITSDMLTKICFMHFGSLKSNHLNLNFYTGHKNKFEH